MLILLISTALLGRSRRIRVSELSINGSCLPHLQFVASFLSSYHASVKTGNYKTSAKWTQQRVQEQLQQRVRSKALSMRTKINSCLKMLDLFCFNGIITQKLKTLILIIRIKKMLDKADKEKEKPKRNDDPYPAIRLINMILALAMAIFSVFSILSIFSLIKFTPDALMALSLSFYQM
jgi:hypothetical protein